MKNISKIARTWHRYLGFFLAGIMIVYALSGVVLIFRNTDFLKQESHIQTQIEPNISQNELGSSLKIKVKRIEEKNGIYYFNDNGMYYSQTGEVSYTKKELPYILNKMVKLHKATTNSPLYFLNIFFGIALLFFAISSLFMFKPASSIFKKGMYFVAGGVMLALIMIFI